METKLSTLARATTLMLAVASMPLSAQVLNMDLSGLMQQQTANWNVGMAAAQQAASDWFWQAQAYRAQTGYAGFLPSPISQASLQASIQGMNRAFDSYNHAWHGWSNRTCTAVENYANWGILGQAGYVNPDTGATYTLPTSSSFWWSDASGTTFGTNTYTPPSYQGSFTPLQQWW